MQASNTNILIEWCRQNGFFINHSNKDLPETHLLLNGGRLSIPDCEANMFLRQMAKALDHEGAWLYVVEKKTERHRLFVELDLHLWDIVLTKETVFKWIMPPFSRVMSRVYGHCETFEGIVCMAPPVVVNTTPEGHRRIKNGIHIIWPRIVVNETRAWNMRACFLHELHNTDIPEIASAMCDPWEVVVDECVFKKNGLRMLRNRKASICKECKGVPLQKRMMNRSKRQRDGTSIIVDISPCTVCRFVGKIDEGRPYKIVGVIDSPDEAASMTVLMDTYQALCATSIRLPQEPFIGTTDQIISKDMWEHIVPFIKRRPATGTNTNRRVQMQQMLTRTSSTRNTTPLESLPLNDPIYMAIVEYMTNHFNPPHVVRNIHTVPDHKLFIVNTSSKWCENKKGEHGSSTVYYLFVPMGYRQKCWSSKGVIHHPNGVPCSTYTSELKPYACDMTAVFPNTSKTLLGMLNVQKCKANDGELIIDHIPEFKSGNLTFEQKLALIQKKTVECYKNQCKQ